MVGEGASINGTVTRNGDTASDLTVYLFSHDASELLVPVSVTIPAGQTTALFAIQGIEDNIADGGQAAQISAYASEYSALHMGM